MAKLDSATTVGNKLVADAAEDSPQTPNIVQKIIDRVRSVQWLVSTLCYLAGALWLTGAAHPRLISRTYFSENALLPGLVDHEFDDHRHLSEMFMVVDSASRKRSSSSHNSDEYLNLLQRQFADVGVQLERHEFGFEMPFSHHKKSISGTNLYGIMRSHRSPSLESFIIATQLDNPGGLAVMHALARLFTQKHYWAKDVIFLLADSLVGAEAWMQAYFDMQSPFIAASSRNFIRRRGGMIQTGIVLDVLHDRLTHVDLQFTGHTGQFTNLDLVNVAVRLCEQEQLDVGFAQILPHAMRWKPHNHGDLDQMLQESFVLARVMATAATCNATNMHGMFLKYNVQALTLRGVPPAPTTAPNREEFDYSLYHYTRAVEGIARVQNNIIQKLYRSFFFYLLSSPNHYVPIGYYMPAVGLLVAPLVLKALFCWLDAAPTNRAERFRSVRSGSLMPALIVLCIIYASCVCCHQSITAFPWLVQNYLRVKLSADFMLGFTVAVLNLTACAVYMLTNRILWPKNDQPSVGDRSLFNCAVLLHAGIVVAVLSMLNFSLGFFVALVAVPLTLLSVIVSSKRTFINLFVRMLLLLAHPCVLAILLQTASDAAKSGSLQWNALSSGSILRRTWSNATQHLLDSFVVGSGLFPITYVLLWPLWLFAWAANTV